MYPKGGDFSAVARGGLPLVWGHDYKEIPIGRVTKVWTDAADNLYAEWIWLENDPLADRVRNAWNQDVAMSASIGFIPKDSVRNKEGGHDHLHWELIELSLCVVPSNRDAVRELKMLGLWADKEERMEVDITPEQVRMIPQLVREHVDAELQKVLAPRRDGMSDADIYRFMREDAPGIVREALFAHVRSEVALAMRRLAGRVD